MPVVDTSELKVVERLPGWRGRYFHCNTMTFAHYEFDRDATIHEHFHPEEEVYEVLEGELEIRIDGVIHSARPGVVAIVPGNVRHHVRALTDGRVIVVDSPSRLGLGPMHECIGAVSLILNFLRFWGTMVSKIGGAYAASQLQTA